MMTDFDIPHEATDGPHDGAIIMTACKTDMDRCRPWENIWIGVSTLDGKVVELTERSFSRVGEIALAIVADAYISSMRAQCKNPNP